MHFYFLSNCKECESEGRIAEDLSFSWSIALSTDWSEDINQILWLESYQGPLSDWKFSFVKFSQFRLKTNVLIVAFHKIKKG